MYLTDAELLHRLATAKPETVTAQVKSEGWKWVEAMPTLGYSELSVFRRAAQTERESTAWERKRIAKLDAERARIKDASVTAAPIYQQGDQATRACRRLLLAPVSLMHLKGPGATPPGFVVD